MRGLAEFVMKGRNQAVFTAVIAATVPLMFWLAAAVVGLVTLRRGLTEGVGVAGFVLIPALFWIIYLGEPTPIIVIFSALIMSLVLRATMSWEKMLAAGVATAAAGMLLVPMIIPDLVEQVVKVGKDLLTQVEPTLLKELGDAEFESATRSLMLGSMAVSYFIFSLIAVLLARNWQSKLYNPGGFQEEFHGFRLSRLGCLAGLLLAMMLSSVGGDMAALVLVIPVPYVIAGIALVHGVIAKKSKGGVWLFWFYAIAFIMGPSLIILLVFLAITDSWVDFRGRIVQAE
ncbi:MAG: hypothetical protein H7A01_02625 [Hahellaceae bacterium]|jgi:hypothetical protein|nr:hypothetical protein [Hahellaceae bacterium]MCP5212462.1 hypothetical protein [Hahellaceae bacterium]